MYFKQLCLLLIAIATVENAFGFRHLSAAPFKTRASASTPSNVARPMVFEHIETLITAAADAKPDGYVYGAVNAPDFILPLTAVLAILTAAIPFLLRSGEQALDQQRIDEDTVNNPFGGKRKDV
mmetsp:Transcript_32805/g.55318  ORF Transcript_32805/g.55318 Transcript_32805/m.55318 type:complete len:124 (+) Transcript_32805:118-489(+)|eukprot:CAMPEP_0174963384 /NCGR_PEP_ID=MMETSP0004_2-20121128/5303_1 /TAXON_ID=420556 /ORGANISM="Ochromonas sp., Strain CCMP1393" /LENGTH=123 /DNA_ID=CAMNT_0016212009 /DNA_START=98 /DNA_END=469 /DNA_ORIENTATION=-